MTYTHEGRTYRLVKTEARDKSELCRRCHFARDKQNCPKNKGILICCSLIWHTNYIFRETLMSRFRNWLKNRGRG